jgi:histidine triad (HIT) family protein
LFSPRDTYGLLISNSTSSTPDIFGDILAGRAPCHTLWEDDVALAFLDIFPQGRGHTLIVPKRVFAAFLLDMSDVEIGPFMARVQAVGRGLVAALRADGLELVQLSGAAAGQTMFRLHVHLLPRWAGVPIVPLDKTTRADEMLLAATASEIRNSWPR